VVRRPRMQVDLMPNQTAPSSCDGAARGDKRGPAACEPPPSSCDGAARGDKRGPAACELCGCGAFARRTSVQLELMRPPRHGNRAKSNPETALYLLTASPRARVWRGTEPVAVPCATSRRGALRVPRHRRKISAFHEGFIHLQR
jgi:hypothetical protein